MRVLVTGSSGFVGQNLVPHLIRNQIKVIGLDYRPFPNPPEGFAEKIYRLGSSQEDIADTLDSCDVVLHLASESHVDRSIAGPEAFVQNNVAGTLELFEATRRAKNVKQIVLFSTDEVGACLEEGSFTERGMPFKCGSVYSATKGAQELLAQAYLNTYSLPAVTTRCVNIFGPHQAEEKFISTVIRKALRNEQIPIYGSGMQSRQWVHVGHVCSFLNEISVSNMIPPGTILHLSGTSEIPNIFIAHAILNFLGKPASLIQHVEDRLGHDVRYSLGRTEETDRFMLSERYDPEKFMGDLESTVRWFEKSLGETCKTNTL